MKRQLVRFGSIGLSSMLLASVGLSGIAAADSITLTGPNSFNNIRYSSSANYTVNNNNNVNVSNSNQQAATTGSVTVEDNTLAGCLGAPMTTMPTTWQGWNPAAWQTNNQSFNAWWSALMQQAGTYAINWTGGGNNWMPSGNNWQATWTSWDPAAWQANGQSFGNWYGQLLPFMMQNYSTWQANWPCGNGLGGATSGNASNVNNTGTTITITNHGLLGANTGPGGFGGGSISNTGPGSKNTVSSYGNNNVHAVLGSQVGVGNGNGQGAASGPVYGHTNTGFGGGSGSGNAGNNNGTQTGVGVNNGTPVTPPAPTTPASSTSTISNTGPGSTNVITTSVHTTFSETNWNNVGVSNSNTQSATSGTVTVSDNTTAGGAASGNAMNANSTQTNLTINN